MAKFYFQLFACFWFALNLKENVEASDTGRCGAVKAATKLNSKWSVSLDQKSLTWIGYATSSTVLKTCTCNPKEVDELGDVSRIQYTCGHEDSTIVTGTVHVRNLCLNCPGPEVAVTNFNFTVGVWEKGKDRNETGPCPEVDVYRCSCSVPTTPKPTSSPLAILEPDVEEIYVPFSPFAL